MTVNPAGYVAPFDGGNPRIIGGIANAVVSGGGLCHVSGAANAVSSGINSYLTSDLIIVNGASGAKFNGVAIQDTASGIEVGIATRGIVISRAAGTIINGQHVSTVGADAVAPLAVTSGAVVTTAIMSAVGAKIGRAITNGTSGNYVAWEINP